jgi:hypothetical protein
MSLASHQRKLLGLIKSTYEGSNDEDPYIREVTGSTNLEVMREIATWWRALNIERYCVLTTSLLKSWDIFERTVEEFAKTREPSRFIECLGTQFLEEMGQHENHLISSVARFELALIRVQGGDTGKHVVDWQHDPAVVLDKLLCGAPLGEGISGGYYRTIVSNEEPGLFRILKVEGAGAP